VRPPIRKDSSKLYSETASANDRPLGQRGGKQAQVAGSLLLSYWQLRA